MDEKESDKIFFHIETSYQGVEEITFFESRFSDERSKTFLINHKGKIISKRKQKR